MCAEMEVIASVEGEIPLRDDMMRRWRQRDVDVSRLDVDRL
jgi:hypothetical protein